MSVVPTGQAGAWAQTCIGRTRTAGRLDPVARRLSDPRRVRSATAEYQQWQALLTNRSARSRARAFLVQGVRPITAALEHGHPLPALLVDADARLSDWARDVLARSSAPVVEMSAPLLAGLAEADTSPELVAVARLPADRLERIGSGRDDRCGLVLVLDRPTQPGNIGSLIRSADAFGADGVVVCGHAADPYDPAAVRASTGSLFALPVVRVNAPNEVLEWAGRQRLSMVGTDEGRPDAPAVPVADADLSRPLAIVVGNETRGMSAAWRTACELTVAIPMRGWASSLNAANAGSIVLYEADRQRRGAD